MEINKNNPLLIKVSSIKKDLTKSCDEMQTTNSTASTKSTTSGNNKSKYKSKDVEMEVEDNSQSQLNKEPTKCSTTNEKHTTKANDKMDVDVDPRISNAKPKINVIIEKEESKSSFKNKMPEQSYSNKDKENKTTTNDQFYGYYAKDGYSKSKFSSVNEMTRNAYCGLRNLGNTCFMNAALQSFCHTPDIVNYFLNWKYDPYKSYFSPKCVATNEFCNLVQLMWKNESSSFSPSDFKNNLGRYIPLLVGYNQHDSYDLFSRLRELLRNELASQTKISFDETEEHKVTKSSSGVYKNEDTIITRTFLGVTKTIIRCSECGYSKDSSQSHLDLHLSIPSKLESYRAKFKVYPLNMENGFISTYEFKFNNNSTMICEFEKNFDKYKGYSSYYEYYILSGRNNELLKIDQNSSFKKLLEKSESKTELEIVVYELEKLEDDHKYYNFELWRENKYNCKQIKQDTTFKIALSQTKSLACIHKAVFRYLFPDKCNKGYRPSLKDSLDETIMNTLYKERKYKIMYKLQSIVQDSSKQNDKDEYREIEFLEDFSFEQLCEFEENDPEFRIIQLSETPLIKFKSPCFSNEVGNKYNGEINISVYDCLKEYCVEEIYPDDSPCEHCGKVADNILESKINISPKYLQNEHYSESSYYGGNNFYSKRQELIDYPIDGLNLTNYYNGESPETNCIYDLYSVIHHSGSTGGGHYWATIRNDTNSSDWYSYNDSSVNRCSESSVLSSSGYVLFYVKREVKTLKTK